MSEEINIALETARATHGPFIFTPRGASQAVADALAQEASRTGRELLPPPVESVTQRQAREAATDGRPTVNVKDSRTFLANLKDVASGKVKAI